MWTPIACEQALYLGDIVKSGRARGTRKETRRRGTVEKNESGPARLRRSLARSRVAPFARRLGHPWPLLQKTVTFFLVNLT